MLLQLELTPQKPIKGVNYPNWVKLEFTLEEVFNIFELQTILRIKKLLSLVYQYEGPVAFDGSANLEEVRVDVVPEGFTIYLYLDDYTQVLSSGLYHITRHTVKPSDLNDTIINSAGNTVFM